MKMCAKKVFKEDESLYLLFNFHKVLYGILGGTTDIPSFKKKVRTVDTVLVINKCFIEHMFSFSQFLQRIFYVPGDQ